jgi:hypothetical protein
MVKAMDGTPRRHGLWLSKRDNGKDEVFLCKLTNFDVYSVTRVMKTPKPFVFRRQVDGELVVIRKHRRLLAHILL